MNIGGTSGNLFTFGTEAFTGVRSGVKGNWSRDPANPTNGKNGTYAQSYSEKKYNNGQTFFKLNTSYNVSYNLFISGGENSGYQQASIHNTSLGGGAAEFDYSLSKPTTTTQGGAGVEN